jgi:hypothetical protein
VLDPRRSSGMRRPFWRVSCYMFTELDIWATHWRGSTLSLPGWQSSSPLRSHGTGSDWIAGLCFPG